MAKANAHLTDELYSFTTCDILIVDLDTGIELYSGKLKSHSINKASNKTAIKAGIGGITWIELEDSNEITIEISDLAERIDMESLKLAGTLEVPVEDGFELTAFPKNYELPAPQGQDFEISLPVDHKDVHTLNQEIALYRVEHDLVIAPKLVKLEDGKITIDVTNAAGDLSVVGLEEGEIILVGSYKYKQDGVHVIKIAADQVGTNVSVTLKQPLYGADRKVKMWRQYHFYRCSLGTEFSQESATEMAEQNTSSSFTVLKDPKRDELGFVAYVPVTPAYGTGNAPFSARPNRSKK